MKTTNNLLNILQCTACGRPLTQKGRKLVCPKGHTFDYVNRVPVMATLDDYQEKEAIAWEDEWKKGVSKPALKAYKKNMTIFKKLGFWEESGEAARLIPSSKEYTVLDLGCGNGVSTKNIKGNFVVGMDLSRAQMARAKKRFPNTHFVVGDAQRLPFKSETFDLVVVINLLHHVPSPNKSLREIHRVLKKGGKIVTVDPNLYNPIGFVGRGLFRLLSLSKVFPTFPQFALGEDERQFTKVGYYELYKKSPFKKFVITPHRIERLLFFSTILIPQLIHFPGYEKMLIFTSRFGNKLVKIKPIDNICYFWIGEATK